MPAPTYPTLRATSHAACPIRARVPGSSSGDGASSTTFWCRRCSEHSRSPRCTTCSDASAMSCTSMCRGARTSRSSSRVSSPNAAAATRRAPTSASGSSSRPSTTTHALAAPARRRLDQQRVPHPVGRLRVVDPRERHARDHRHARGGHVLLGPDLVPHDLQRLDAGSDEHHARRLARAREVRVLGQEAVPGVDRLRTGRPRGADHGVDRQVAVDLERGVGARDVQGVTVDGGVHGHGPDPEPPQGRDAPGTRSRRGWPRARSRARRSHPEEPEAGLAQRDGRAHVEGHAEHPARVRRVDDRRRPTGARSRSTGCPASRTARAAAP